MANDALLLDRRTNDEARHVVQKHERNRERITQPHEPRHLVRGIYVKGAAEHHRVRGHDADGLSTDASKAGDDVARPRTLHREEVAIVNDSSDDLVHVVGPPWRCRHDLVELFHPSVDRIVRGLCGNRSRVVRRKERQIPTNGREALFVAAHFHIGHTRHLGVHFGAAHFFLGDIFACCRAHEMATTERHRRRAFHHRHKVAQRWYVGRSRRAVAEHRGNHGHHTRHVHLLAKQGAGRRKRRTRRRLNARTG
jgi:hypothetical protein